MCEKVLQKKHFLGHGFMIWIDKAIYVTNPHLTDPFNLFIVENCPHRKLLVYTNIECLLHFTHPSFLKLE